MSVGLFTGDSRKGKYEEKTYFTLKVTMDDYNEIISMIQRVYKLRERGRVAATKGEYKRNRLPRDKVKIEITGIVREIELNGKVIHSNHEPANYVETRI